MTEYDIISLNEYPIHHIGEFVVQDLQADRETSRATDRQAADRHTGRQGRRQTDKHADRLRNKARDRQTSRRTDRVTRRETDRQADGQTERQGGRQTDKQRDRPRDKAGDRQTSRRTDRRSGEQRATHNVDELREADAELDHELVRVAVHWSDEFVVSTPDQQVVVQAFRVVVGLTRDDDTEQQIFDNCQQH